MLQIAGGSVTGSRHQNKLNVKNNQDAYGWQLNDNRACAVVADGCGSSKHSEVGARLLSQIVASELSAEREHLEWSRNYTDGLSLSLNESLNLVRYKALQTIRLLVEPPRGVGPTVKDYLATVMGVLVSYRHVTIFSIGDGVAYLNGEKVELPDYDNKPPYLAYGLNNDGPHFQIHAQIPVEDFESCLIGSDGVDDLGNVSEFWDDDTYFQNKDQIRRRLAVINKRKIVDGREVLGPLVDDTTLVAIRKGNCNV